MQNRLAIYCAVALLFAAYNAMAADSLSTQAQVTAQGVSKMNYSGETPQLPTKKSVKGSFYGQTLVKANAQEKEVALVDDEDDQPVKKKQTGNLEVKERVKATSDDEIPLPATTPDGDIGGQIAMPEISQKAILSRSDVNRIVCSQPIKDVFYSEEKGVKVSYSGNNAFVKFEFEKQGNKMVYSATPSELFIICGDTTYNLVALPKGVPSQTIRLDSGKAQRAKENVALFREDTYKKKLQELIRRTYMDDLPDSFTVTNVNKSINVFRELACVLKRTVTVDGEGFVVKEYSVTSLMDGMELSEKEFLRKEFARNPKAIAFEPNKLKPGKGEKVRLFIVEAKAAKTEGGETDVQ